MNIRKPSGDDRCDALFDACQLVAGLLHLPDLESEGVIWIFRMHAHLACDYLALSERLKIHFHIVNEALRREIAIAEAMRQPHSENPS